MTSIGRSILLLSRVVRNSAVPLPRRDIRIRTRLVTPTVFWKECSTSNTSTSAQNIQDVSVETESVEAGSSASTESTDSTEPANSDSTEAVQEYASAESRQEFIKRVKKDTWPRLDIYDYKQLYKDLHHHLSNNKKVKATDINIILYNTRNKQQMEKVKALLHLFRLSPSFNRDSLSSVVVKMCLRLRGLHHALEIISDPVKYGIFPGRASLTKLMEAFAKRGDVDGFEKVCGIMEGLDHGVTLYEGRYRIMACTIALTKKLSRKSDTQEKQPDCAPQELETAEETTTPEISAEEGETSLHSEGSKQLQGADVSAEVVEDVDGATPTQGSTEISNAGVEECVISEDEAKEELNHILRLCHDQYRNNPERAIFSYYFVSGKVMGNELHSLTKYMIDKLHEEKSLPQRLLLNLRMDYHRIQFEYAEVIKIFKEMKEAQVLLARKRLPKLQAFFEDCPSPDLKKSFQDLNVEDMCLPPPPHPPTDVEDREG